MCKCVIRESLNRDLKVYLAKLNKTLVIDEKCFTNNRSSMTIYVNVM
jgi:hypothetical protein